MINHHPIKNYIFLAFFIWPVFLFGQKERTRFFPKKTEVVKKLPDRKHLWVFIMAGQSNMAGRAQVEPQDTVPDERILTIDKGGQIILAKEPLHFQEPGSEGLDCGLSFGKAMLAHLPSKTKILLLPAAIGGSSIGQWSGDSLFRKVKLLSNFKERSGFGKKYGIIKGILWHQGENDANPENIPLYKERLTSLFSEFRKITGNPSLPVLLGEIGSFTKNIDNNQEINRIIREYVAEDKNTVLISTKDLNHKGDNLHFNSQGQRTMGQRYAAAFLDRFK
jgi:hypothetical protein